MSDDWTLLERWRGGDEDAANTLLGRYFDLLLRFFYTKVACPEDATDLVSETMLGCVKARDRIHTDNFRAFIFAVASNQFRLYIRKKNKRSREEADFTTVCAADLGAQRSLSWLVSKRQEVLLLIKGLRMIPLNFQIALELHLVEGLRGPEIGTLLGIPTATAYSRIRLGREHLQKAIAALEVDPALCNSTLTNIEQWALGVRQHIPRS